jgi:hypothetical protein
MGDHGAGQYLDTAGGYGMLTRLMRDIGFNFYWADKYCENLLAPRFDYKVELGACHAVTAIEVLEHLTDPAAFVEETLAAAGSQTLIFTTELYIGSPPHPDAWWYYTFGTGQHIGFFQRRTLETLGARLGLKLVSANGLHVLSKKHISERTLALATGRLAMRISPWWIRRRLGSKTMSDHQLMLQGNVTHNSAHQ